MIHDLHGERLSEEQWKALAEAGFQHTRQIVSVTFDVSLLPRKRGCEGTMHRMLKQVAAEMLVELGETEVKFEHDGFDIYGATLGIVVECGGMSITKIFETLIDKNSFGVKEIWHLSFPKLESYCVLTKFQCNAKPCNYIDYCKPNEWSKREMRTCKLNGKDCYIRRQYLLRDCLHLNGYETLTKNER